MIISSRNVAIILLLFVSLIFSQTITGSGSVQLNGPARRDQVNQAKATARSMLKKEVLRWLSSNHQSNIDTTNGLRNYHIETLIDTCLNRAKEESSYKGKDLMISLNLNMTAADEALVAFNKAMEKTAVESWSAVTKAQETNDIKQVFYEAIKTYSASLAIIGPPLATPGTAGNDLSYDAHKIIQTFFNKLKVSSSNMIVQGKIGRPAENPPEITAVIDSIPLPELWFNGSLQSGKINFKSRTDGQGKIVLNDLVIPLVATGALFYLTPDFGNNLSTLYTIHPKDLNITLRDGQMQTFMFKVTRPTFTLDYKMQPDETVKLPADFTNSAPLKKYLRDSCFFTDAEAGVPPDFMIVVESKISRGLDEKTEEIGMNLLSEITVKGLSLATPKTEQERVTLKKFYEKSLDIPFGLFLWDVNTALRQGIRAALRRL